MKLCSVPGGGSAVLKYEIECDTRGYYQLGPTLLETGDLFGLHRRHRIVTRPFFLMVLPKVLPLPKYDFASQRPIGEVNAARRLFEDPTRNAGVRPYQVGDPLAAGPLAGHRPDRRAAVPRLRPDHPGRGEHPRGLPQGRLPGRAASRSGPTWRSPPRARSPTR